MIHEFVHDFILKGYKGMNEAEHHELMASNYRGVLIDGMKEFANTNGIDVSKLTEEDWNTLSWSGLEGTDAFQKRFDVKKEKDGSILLSKNPKVAEYMKNLTKLQSDTKLNISDEQAKKNEGTGETLRQQNVDEYEE